MDRHLTLPTLAAILFLVANAVSTSAADSYQGKYTQGTGDAAALQLIDQSFQFLHANPDVPNLTMLYRPDWNTLTEGAGWNAWWIQNSYGFTYASTPFLQPWARTTVQNSLDLFWNNQGDGVRKGQFGAPGSPLYEMVAPNGALGDCAAPNSIVYKQGDGNVAIHDWMYEATAAGVVMQGEMLLSSRDRTDIANYLPKMERAINSIDATRDPSNNLFLVGPAANLLAPSYGGTLNPATGNFDKGYLTGLSISYLAAVDRMVELYKLTGDAAKQADYQHRADITRASLSQLTATGPQGTYFVKSVEKTNTGGLGTKHGVLDQSQYGYLEGVANVDAVALRVADSGTAQSIYSTIAANPAIRPNNFLLTNSAPLDDMYTNYGGTDQSSYWQNGEWVNGGAWGTVEGRAILAYAPLGKFDDITRSAQQAMKWAKDFRMDAPFTQSGANTSNYWSDTGSNQVGGVAVMIDNFAIPAATARGLFDYDYRSDRLLLRPRIPESIREYVQNEPVYFGDKKIYLSCQNGGPNVKTVKINGVSVDVASPAEADLLYASLPADAHVEIVTEGGWPASALPPSTPGTYTTADPAPLSSSLRKPYGVMQTMRRLLDTRSGADYEQSFVRESIGAIEAWQVSCATDREPGTYRPMTAEKIAAINNMYHATALNMYSGLASHMNKSDSKPLWDAVTSRTASAAVSSVTADGPDHMIASAMDLANQGLSALSSISSSAPSQSGGSVHVLNDGAMNDHGADLRSTSNAYVPSQGDQVTITLDTSVNTHGYNIAQIVSYSAHSTDRVCQNYDIDVLQVGSTDWVAVFSGYDMGRDVQAAFEQDSLGRELRVTIQDVTGALLATNVQQIRFMFHDTNGFGATGGATTAYREFDVFGVVSAPEPSSLKLAILGLAFCGGFCIVKSQGRSGCRKLGRSASRLATRYRINSVL